MDWAQERNDILVRFLTELMKPTGDGSKKRQGGSKPPWFSDSGHEAAIFSHILKWKRGEKVDPESGAHPLVHAAWRCLAIACIESNNVPSPTSTAPSGLSSVHPQAQGGVGNVATCSARSVSTESRPEKRGGDSSYGAGSAGWRHGGLGSLGEWVDDSTSTPVVGTIPFIE